jgi:hypothetical protein
MPRRLARIGLLAVLADKRLLKFSCYQPKLVGWGGCISGIPLRSGRFGRRFFYSASVFAF